MIHTFLRSYRHGIYRLCRHRSHRLHLPCYRAFVWDGYCAKHNQTCPDACYPHPLNAGFDGSCRDCGDFEGEGVHA